METLKISKISSIDGSRNYSFEFVDGLRMEAAFFTIAGRERRMVKILIVPAAPRTNLTSSTGS
jgi:hypothetical protein